MNNPAYSGKEDCGQIECADAPKECLYHNSKRLEASGPSKEYVESFLTSLKKKHADPHGSMALILLDLKNVMKLNFEWTYGELWERMQPEIYWLHSEMTDEDWEDVRRILVEYQQGYAIFTAVESPDHSGADHSCNRPNAPEFLNEIVAGGFLGALLMRRSVN